MLGHIECCSKPILGWIAENIPNVIVNIIGQYHPTDRVFSEEVAHIQRKVTSDEMKEVFVYADSLQLEYKYVSLGSEIYLDIYQQCYF